MSTAIAGPPVQDLVEGGTWALRHVYPVLPWFSAAVLTTPGVIRYYRLDETAGVNAADAVAGQTGTYTGGPTLAAAGLWTPDDAANRAVTFVAASSQYVSVPTIDFATAVKSHTIEMVASVASLAARAPLFTAFGAALTGQTLGIFVNTTGSIVYSFFLDDLTTATGVVLVDTTYHLVFTFDAATDTSRIYINGTQVASGANGPYTGTATPTCRIASYSATPEFTSGTVDEVAIYARALSAAEVRAHAEAAGLATSSTVNGGAVKRSSTLILGKPYGATFVPVSTTPGSPDFAQGSYTHRLDDAGEFTLTFPNGVASDGVLWRERFTPDGHRDWIEVYRGVIGDAANLEFVGTTEKVTVARDAVTVTGGDAFNLLKKAFETDREWTAAPRDIVEAYSRVPVVVSAEEFTSGTSPWTPAPGCTLTIDTAQQIGTVGGNYAGFYQLLYQDFADLGDTWDIYLEGYFGSGIAIQLGPAGGDIYLGAPKHSFCVFNWGSAGGYMTTDGTNTVQVTPSQYVTNPGPNATMTMSRRGRWLYAWQGTTFLGVLPWIATAPTQRVTVGANGGGARIKRIAVRSYKPLLERGSTLGDRHLPGTYPTGGLRGRYYNNADLQGFSSFERRYRVFAPGRAVSTERLDATPAAGLASLPANLPTDYFAVRWFGAVYLRGDLGDYQFRLTTVDDGARLWVGNLDWGDQILDDWADGGSRTIGPVTLASSVFGSRGAWVPIVLEYHDATSVQTLGLEFSPPGAGTYTDPGGGTVTRGAFAAIPSTSLSALGCFDNRVQGTSHYDLVKQASDAFGLHLWLEPMTLESGESPGRLTARERWGRDTDIQLRSEDLDVTDPLLSPTIETDASDSVTTLRGFGAGIADGRGGQTIAEITDSAATAFALFDLQGQSDAGDIAFRDLLAARLDAELGLRNTPWTNITGQPRGRERLADTWPLTSTYSAMRWRPGDAVRLSIPDIGVDDATPRQVLQVTREIVPEGLASCQVAFRQRPRGPAAAIRKATRQALLPRRVYQRQKEMIATRVEVDGPPAGTFTGYQRIALLPQDQVIRGVVRISENTASQPIGVEINATIRTTALGGTWTLVPLEIDITPYAVGDATFKQLFVRLQNTGASATALTWQLIIEVLR